MNSNQEVSCSLLLVVTINEILIQLLLEYRKFHLLTRVYYSPTIGYHRAAVLSPDLGEREMLFIAKDLHLTKKLTSSV